jgi:diguanylate cyclase (GGDEF)-like protein/PAS domain S-box-containing protein
MTKFRRIAFFCVALVLAAPFLVFRLAPAWAAGKAAPQINFGSAGNVLALKGALSPYRAPGGPEADGSSWYIVQVNNDSVRAATRVLVAGQPPRMALYPIARRTRPAILAVASSDSGTVVETASAYGRRAWRVTVPPVTSVGLAIRVANAQTPPALYAWTEPALSSHNRQLAIFITAVGALIGAAMLITGGLAVLIGHAAPRWVAITLLMLLAAWLSGTGMFDASIATRIGGPYGLSAFLTALALAAGARLANAIIPFREIWPGREKLLYRGIYGLIALGLLAYLGVPAGVLLTDIAIVTGSIGIAVYLIYCGRRGHKAAQVIAPSALAFALVALAAAVIAVGGLGESLTGPAATGGFAAAGAILLALAVIASEEIAVLPFLHGSSAARILEAQAPATPEAMLDLNAPMNSLARAAIGAAHQGVFNLDFRNSLLTLSQEAAQMVGLSMHETTLSRADWIAHIHPDDREIYVNALEEYRHRPGLAFRLEFRARGQSGPYRWIELRATIVTDEDVPSDCLGLMSDVTQRKEAEFAAQQAEASRERDAALPRDALTGLGNRVALMEALDALGDGFDKALFALLDIDRFKAIHASLGDTGADAILRQVGERLSGLGEPAQIFRVGGDSFAFLFASPRRAPQPIGNALAESCSRPYVLGGITDKREVFAPCSIGLATGAQSEDPFALIKNAELALISAKRQGGACARVYSSDLENLAPGDSVALESELRHALAADQLDVFYQPIVRLSDRGVAGFEALLRWQHPVKGLVSPADFIAHSEETGLIVELGRFALEKAATDLAHWQRYFPLKPPLFVSVNFSRRQLRDPSFEALLKTILSGSGITEGTLNLEITESAIAADPKMPEMMARIRAMGAGLSIDDFGTGASTLSEFRTLPVDTVKIDRSFLARHGGTDIDTDGEVVLAGIVSMAHELKRSVVAEGVESEADAQFLARIGCEFGQGFYFAPALDGAAALDYIARHYSTASAPEPG